MRNHLVSGLFVTAVVCWGSSISSTPDSRATPGPVPIRSLDPLIGDVEEGVKEIERRFLHEFSDLALLRIDIDQREPFQCSRFIMSANLQQPGSVTIFDVRGNLPGTHRWTLRGDGPLREFHPTIVTQYKELKPFETGDLVNFDMNQILIGCNSLLNRDRPSTHEQGSTSLPLWPSELAPFASIFQSQGTIFVQFKLAQAKDEPWPFLLIDSAGERSRRSAQSLIHRSPSHSLHRPYKRPRLSGSRGMLG